MLLPLVLIASTVAGLGSYCETSDDTTLAWLFSGVLATKAVSSLPLYFHGFGHVLAAAYTNALALPWLGILLGLLLTGATILAFAVLDKLLRPHLRPLPLAGVLVAFFVVGWLEHWLWFSWVRVAVLGAGTALLYAAQRPGRLGPVAVAVLGVSAATLLRPSMGALGLLAATPAAWWLMGNWRRALPLVLACAVAVGVIIGGVAALQTPTSAATQARDRCFARILDFGQLRPEPRTPADSLGTEAVGLWMLGDATVVNDALCQHAYRFDAAYFWGQEVPAKLRLRAALLVRDYFPMLLLLVFAAFAAWRLGRGTAGFWLMQAGFLAALILLAGVLKLPPRLKLPVLDFWLLANLSYLLKPASSSAYARPVSTRSGFPPFSPLERGVGICLFLLTIGAYGLKTWHRRGVLTLEQQQHEAALRTIEESSGGRRIVMAGTNDFLKSLSPFRTYGLGTGRVLLLTGWSAHDISQARLRQAWVGTPDQNECLRRIAQPAYKASAAPLWVLTSQTAIWLNRRFRVAKSGPVLYPASSSIGQVSDAEVRIYHVQGLPRR